MRRGFRLGLVLAGLLIGLACSVGFAGQVVEGPFEVGRRWVYRHEGPRPGSMEPNAIDGQRVLHVISETQEQGERSWAIEERFTNDPNVIGRLHVNEARMLTALDIENEKGEAAALYYDPPVPYLIAEMEIGRTKTVETTLRVKSGEFALPATIAIERLPDETVTTPAGEFAGCLHYKVTNRSTINVKVAKIPITEQRLRWYHADVNGLVKEVYRREPIKFLMWSKDGYTATSILETFDTAPVEAREEPAGSTAPAPETARTRGDRPAGTLFPAAARLVVLGGLVVLAGAGCVLIRGVRGKRPTS
ncbi:MAG: hypothetical protein JW741_30380 [Sedimentisphaerales bacterium]|nr:hypothetical protein [Sedimentisphaerales bacterium]